MEKILMNASWLASIILVLVGIIKLPFAKLKEKHPKWYKVTFFLLSLILVVVGSILAELYIFETNLYSWTFATLLVSTGFIVFGGYSAYECTGLKDGIKKIVNSLKTALTTYSDSKLAKMIGKVGIEKINSIADRLKEEQNVSSQDAPVEVIIEPKEDAVVEQKLTATIIEEPNNE